MNEILSILYIIAMIPVAIIFFVALATVEALPNLIPFVLMLALFAGTVLIMRRLW